MQSNLDILLPVAERISKLLNDSDMTDALEEIKKWSMEVESCWSKREDGNLYIISITKAPTATDLIRYIKQNLSNINQLTKQ